MRLNDDLRDFKQSLVSFAETTRLLGCAIVDNPRFGPLRHRFPMTGQGKKDWLFDLFENAAWSAIKIKRWSDFPKTKEGVIAPASAIEKDQTAGLRERSGD